MLAFIVTPVAVIALAVAVVALVAATLVPRRRRRLSRHNGELTLVFAQTDAPANEPTPGLKENTALSEAPMQHTEQSVIERIDEMPVEQIEEQAAVTMQEEQEQAPRRWGFLGFGMRRKAREAQVDDGVEVIAAPVEANAKTVRKLFTHGKAATVKKHAAHDVTPAEDVESLMPDSAGLIAEVTNDRGTTAVDHRGVIHETPAEGEFPVERFAQNDQTQDVVYATEAQRLEAEHRMELERLAAEREVFDAQHRASEEARESKHRRVLEILEARTRSREQVVAAQVQAQAAVQAHSAIWWVRLDPDLNEPAEAERLRLAGSLEGVRAPWAEKLIRVALDQDESERVRARLIGALARGFRADAQPFEAALTRSQIERWALIESLAPFAHEAEWIEDVLSRAKGTEGALIDSHAEPAAEAERATVDDTAGEANVVALTSVTSSSPQALPVAVAS